jgi:hypothetical protein
LVEGQPWLPGSRDCTLRRAGTRPDRSHVHGQQTLRARALAK